MRRLVWTGRRLHLVGDLNQVFGERPQNVGICVAAQYNLAIRRHSDHQNLISQIVNMKNIILAFLSNFNRFFICFFLTKIDFIGEFLIHTKITCVVFLRRSNRIAEWFSNLVLRYSSHE